MPKISRTVWVGIALVVAVGFFVSATSWDVYRTTSPPHVASRIFGAEAAEVGRPFGISLHVVLRKLYSIAAFTIVGFTATKALGQSAHPPRRAVILCAIYSAAIEVSQFQHGVREGAFSNAFDILCGAIGGWSSAVLGRIMPPGQ